MGTTRMRGRRADGPPVYIYEAMPGVPAVGALRLGRELSPGGLPQAHSHAHDFLVLAYFEQGDGSMWLGDREWWAEAGDVYVIAPGEVVRAGDRVASKRPRAGASSSHPRCSGPRRPEPSSPGAPTRCCSPSLGARQEAPNA